MFEISIPQIRECVLSLEEQEKEMKNLVKRMETVYAGFDGLMEDKSDKKALWNLIEEVEAERRGMEDMKRALSEIVRCYEETERRIVASQPGTGVRNQFGLKDLSKVGQMLDSLNIVFK